MLTEKKKYEAPSALIFYVEEDVLLYSGEGDNDSEYVGQFDPGWLP